VGRASVHPPRLVHCRFGSPQDPLIALVGKGVCFDSGGLDLKNAKGMADMKKDMAGAAHALGLAKYLLATKCPLQILLVLPIVENSVSSDAYRPGDVLTTRQGSTIEINNTDAEGRVILSDALELASAASPKLIIDFASLTGAQRVAMGTDIPSFFCNDKAFSERLMQASERCQDLLWPLPLHQPYRRHIRSAVADISNCADVPYGGSITAALFLEHFVHDGIPWVHFDLSGANASDQPARPKGGEAMGIRACAEAIATWRASLS
jgi:leucyl aminopeptidase